MSDLLDVLHWLRPGNWAGVEAGRAAKAVAWITELQAEIERLRSALVEITQVKAHDQPSAEQPPERIIDLSGWTVVSEGGDGSVLLQSPAGARQRVWFREHLFIELEEKIASLESQMKNQPPEPNERTPEPAKEGGLEFNSGCVYDGAFIKVFVGPRGEAWAIYPQGENHWIAQSHSQSSRGERCGSPEAASARARELAGLEPEPDEPPEAYYAHRKSSGYDSQPSLVRTCWNNPEIDAPWKAGWRAAQEGGEA